MTIARVPSTYTQPLPLAQPLNPVRNQDNIYTLPDDWYIREDVTVGRFHTCARRTDGSALLDQNGGAQHR